MPQVARFSNATLYIYAGDHAPPHFHLLGPDVSCQITIQTLEVLRGSIDSRILAEVKSWANHPANRTLLRKIWRDLNERD